MKREQIRGELPMMMRLAQVQPTTFDAEKRTVDVIWSKGAKVRRYDWWNDRAYDEELSLDPKHVSLKRLNDGAPVLNTHGMWRLEGVMGVVERAWVKDGEGGATLRLSGRADLAPIIEDVKAGIIRNVSVGYVTRKYEIDKTGEVPVYRAIDWEPYEISFVPVGADPGAGVRTGARAEEQQRTFPCEFVTRAAAHNQESEMKPNQADGGNQPAETTDGAQPAGTDGTRAAPPVTDPPKSDDAVAGERARVKEIRALGRSHKLDDKLVDKMVDEGTSVEAARRAVLEELATRSEVNGVRSAHTQLIADETDKTRSMVAIALEHRASPNSVKLEDGARQYRGMSMLEIGRELLEQRGIKTRGLSRMELAGLALGLDYRSGGMSTSDFPAILANVANKTLQRAYGEAPQTFTAFCRPTTSPDFKNMQRTRFGDAPKLELVGENGEVRMGSVGEAKETYALGTYAKRVAFTRQAMINDDLGAFTRMPEMMGRAARRLESDVIYGLILANAAMADTKALFHADHGNLTPATGTAISVASLGVGRELIALQTDLGGSPLNLQPEVLLVPPALTTVGQQYTTATNVIYTKGSDHNPFAGTLKVVTEPRLQTGVTVGGTTYSGSAAAWYLAATPGQVDTIEYAHLEGQEGAYLEWRNGFEVEGMELKTRLDFAAKAIDWRGLYKNVGP